MACSAPCSAWPVSHHHSEPPVISPLPRPTHLSIPLPDSPTIPHPRPNDVLLLAVLRLAPGPRDRCGTYDNLHARQQAPRIDGHRVTREALPLALASLTRRTVARQLTTGSAHGRAASSAGSRRRFGHGTPMRMQLKQLMLVLRSIGSQQHSLSRDPALQGIAGRARLRQGPLHAHPAPRTGTLACAAQVCALCALAPARTRNMGGGRYRGRTHRPPG